MTSAAHEGPPLGIDAPARLGRTALPDGRRLAWAEWGPPEGRPVLLCPGGATGRSLGFGTHLLADLGVRLLSVDRPGLGASDPAPGRTLADWADDVAALLEARGIRRPHLVGYSQGVPFALACAAHGLATAVSAVSGSAEPAAPELADALAPEVRAMVAAVAHDPEGAEATVAASASATSMWDLVTAGCGPADRAVFRQPAFAQAFRRAIEEGFTQGAGGFARDTVLTMGRWPFTLTDITVPVDLWYGEHDTSMFHSHHLSEPLVRALPLAHRHVVRNAGGLLLWTHAEDVLRTLLGHDEG
ncbi:alpha/beta hydrolase [Streptomyces sp. NPDC001657]|uniref:alpha/beta fold hydrolase n=1 Tax=Streptomyces sp. NPDC001657 TaxID=3154522 RepID=UPI0033230A23